MTHTSLHDRLDLDEPTLARGEGADELNALLQEVFDGTTEDLPRLLAQVRTDIGLLPEDFARIAGLTQPRYKPMEKSRDKGFALTREKYPQVFNAWRTREVSEGVREQAIALFNGDLTVHGFYQRMGADLGFASVNKAVPHIWTRLRNREHFPEGVPPPVPALLEVLNDVETLYPKNAKLPEQKARRDLRFQEAHSLWEGEQRVNLTVRTLEEPLIQLFIAMERHLATEYGEGFNTKTVAERFGISQPRALALMNGELCSWEDVKPIAAAVGLGRKGDFKTAWEGAWEEEQERPSFRKEFEAALAQSGHSYVDLAKWLEIESTTPDRAGMIIRAVLVDNVNSRYVPMSALIALVAKNGRERQRLTDAFVEERIRYYQRSGSWLREQGMEMRLARELAGEAINLDTVVALCKKVTGKTVTAKQLQNLEQLFASDSPLTIERVIEVLNTAGERKTERALGLQQEDVEAAEALHQWTNVAGMMQSIIVKCGSAKAVNRKMLEVSDDEHGVLSAPNIQAVADGTLVPSLPVLRNLAKMMNKRLPQEVQNDWFARFPEYLRTRENDPVTSALGRVLYTMIGRMESGSTRRFFEQRYTGGVPSHASMALYKMVKEGKRPNEHIVASTTLSAGYKASSLQYKLALALHASKGSVSQALATIQDDLDQLDGPVTPTELIGLTPRELEKLNK